MDAVFKTVIEKRKDWFGRNASLLDAQTGVEVGDPQYKVDLILRPEGIDPYRPSVGIVDLCQFEANEDCALCGTCVERCFFDAISLDEEANRAVVDQSKCIGCGVCTITCEQEALKLKRVERSEIFATPRDMARKIAKENKGL